MIEFYFNNYKFLKNDDGSIVIDEFLDNYLKDHLSEKRYEHSLSVAKLSYEIAISNNLKCPEKYYFTGLIHDIGKYIDDDLTNKIMIENFSDYLDLPKYAFHAFIGAYLAKKDLNVNDEEIIDAIIYHTTGKKNMSDLAKVVFASDKIEPTRPYDSSDLINKMMSDYKGNFSYIVYEIKVFLDSKEVVGNRLSDELYDYYLK